MKSLLSALAVVSLTTPVVGSLVKQNTINENNYQLSQTVEHYWHSSKSEIEYHREWIRPRYIRGFVHTINVGQTKLSDYKEVSVIDSNNKSYTKVSWGSAAYFGNPLRIIQNWKISDYFVYKKINNLTDALNSTRQQLLNINVNWGLANLKAQAEIGFSYYSEGGSNYIQVFGYFEILTIASFSNGALWLNLGQGIRLIK